MAVPLHLHLTVSSPEQQFGKKPPSGVRAGTLFKCWIYCVDFIFKAANILLYPFYIIICPITILKVLVSKCN